MMEQAVLQLLDPEFWKDSPPGNVSGFWCGEETERLCVTEKEASQWERLALKMGNMEGAAHTT